MGHADHDSPDRSTSSSTSIIRWRAWPCESCSGQSTALDYLVRSVGSSTEFPDGGRNEQIDWRKSREAALLGEWVVQCPHTEWSGLALPDLAEGSEHLVYFDEPSAEVVKVTRPGIYGDYYEIVDGRMTQFDSTPAEYLLRMGWWEKLFSTAPAPVGLTDAGQIVSRQTYIGGGLPQQATVDEFLTDAGLFPVKKNCWLWKKLEAESRLEVWVGDARSDNFVSVAGSIVPIDIRVWGIPMVDPPSSTLNA